MQHRYQIIQADWTLTVNPQFEILRDYAVLVEDNRIRELIDGDDIGELDCFSGAEIVRLPGCALLPG